MPITLRIQCKVKSMRPIVQISVKKKSTDNFKTRSSNCMPISMALVFLAFFDDLVLLDSLFLDFVADDVVVEEVKEATSVFF